MHILMRMHMRTHMLMQVHGISEAEWRAIRRHSLLTKEEQAYLQEYRGSRPHLAAAWALAEVKAAILQPKEGERYDPNHSQLQTIADLTVYNSFKAVFEEFVRHCGASLEVLNQPVPFPYFHVLKLMLVCPHACACTCGTSTCSS